jgi:hypothetical protein
MSLAAALTSGINTGMQAEKKIDIYRLFELSNQCETIK